jgi:hypothetical protein
MEIAQRNSLHSYLKQPKMSVFFFSFSYTKLENRRVKQVLPAGVSTSGKGKSWGNGEGG